MSDRFYVTMSIGGMITRDNLDNLFKAIDESRLEDRDHRSIDNKKDLEECAVSGHPLGLAYDQANYDAIDDLKRFCQDNNLSYRIRWESSGEYEAEIQFWTPGMIEEYEKCVTNNGYDYIHADDVRRIIRDHEKHPAVALKILADSLPLEDPRIHDFYIVNPETLGGKIIEAELLFEALVAA